MKPMHIQSPENTLESLVHGMRMFDGIEFDIRLTSDDQIIIHHDRTISVDPGLLSGRSPFVEDWTLDELREFGFCSFEELINHPEIQKAVQNEGKVLVVETKRPSLKVKRSGGLFARKKHDVHMGRTMHGAEQLLDEYSIPLNSIVHYAFHSRMGAATKYGGIKAPWSSLRPNIRPFGGRRTHRTLALPEFVSNSFNRLKKNHQKNGSPMMPCAIEYLTSPTNRIPVGKTVGLHGKQLETLTKLRQGFPVYIWPVKPNHEHSVLNAGLSALTDYSDPALTWLPSGHARWQQPATLPLDEGQQQLLNSADEENHLSVLTELKKETPPWNEADASRRRELLSYWKAKWNWQTSIDEMLTHSTESVSTPWEFVRMIGHRGSGKTQRPVL
jgi:hypothetical protein